MGFKDAAIAYLNRLPEEGGKDLFVHMSEIKMDGFKTLKEGSTVDYEEGAGEKGPCATNVVPK